MLQSNLILEGGGMRGVFTAGVLDYFLEQGLAFDRVIGVSAGACHACSYVAEQKGRAFATAVDYLDDKRYCSLHSLITTGDLFGAEMLYDIIPRELYPIDNDAFLQNSTIFQAVVTNCRTGRAEYPEIHHLHKDIGWIRASSSLPLLARMVSLQGGLYLDGGVADSIPIRYAMHSGGRRHVAVLTQPREYRKGPNRLLPLLKIKYRKYPALVQAMQNRHIRYNDTLDFLYAMESASRVFVLQPQESLGIGRVEKRKDKLRAAYAAGYREAKDRFVALLTYLQNNQEETQWKESQSQPTATAELTHERPRL